MEYSQELASGLLSHLPRRRELPKAPTGIRGLDEITRGGLPQGRPTLVCGGPGSGKTLLALTFLVNGALQFDEPGVLLTFEENAEEMASDVASLGFDLPELIEAQKLAVDYVRVERGEIEETGEYDLEGLFVRLELRDPDGRRQARRPRHHRIAVRRPEERRHPPVRTATAVPVAEGPGRHRRDHGRARRGSPDPAGTRGVRLRRGDSARPPRPRSGLDAPPARGQVPRLPPRHERVSVPHQCRRHQRAAGVLDGPSARRAAGARVVRRRASRRDAQRQGVLPRQHDPRLRHRGHWKDEPGAPTFSTRRAAGANAACASSSKSRRSSCSGTCAPSASIWSRGWRPDCCNSMPIGRRATGSRRIS